MVESKAVYIYRIYINKKYGWLVSRYADNQFKKVIKKQVNQAKNCHVNRTSIQNAFLKLSNYDINHQLLNKIPIVDKISQVRVIVNDLQNFNPAMVLGQRIANLYFYGAGFSLNSDGASFNGSGSLQFLINLMKKYPQVDFGWPSDPDIYRQKMIVKSNLKPYSQLRAQILKYWFDQCNGNLNWLYSSAIQNNPNYQQAFNWLKQNDAKNKSWYYDQPSGTTGLIWHFTDINNMANILSYQEIASKNWGQKKKIIQNNNAASSVNDAATQPWVHNYARFYLRPKTPTQYRNEGIYQYYGSRPNFSQLPSSLTNKKDNDFWTTGKPAHLPVPVFIGFSLSKFLKRGGHLTKGSLAGKYRVKSNPEEMFDNDFTFLKDHVREIYSESYAPNWIKQTEFIFPQRMQFMAKDILRIVVRSEAEKLVLLTMLTEHDSKLFHDEKTHRQIDLHRYINRIIVDPNFFYYNGSIVQSNSAIVDNSRNQYHLYLQPPIKPGNLQCIEKTFSFTKQLSKGKQQVDVTKLKQITLRVRDVNNEIKDVVRFHDPDWILGVSKWIPSKQMRVIDAARGYHLKNRYYSSLYYNNQYIKLWREEDTNQWHFVDNDLPANILQSKDQTLLKEIEESYQERFIDSSNTII